MTLGQEDDNDSVALCDEFVKKIVGTVSPIIPIALRNKALDGGYLRTALNLMAVQNFCSHSIRLTCGIRPIRMAWWA